MAGQVFVDGDMSSPLPSLIQRSLFGSIIFFHYQRAVLVDACIFPAKNDAKRRLEWIFSNSITVYNFVCPFCHGLF